MGDENKTGQVPTQYYMAPSDGPYWAASRTCEMPCEELLSHLKQDVRKAEAMKNPRSRNYFINDVYGRLYRSGVSGDYNRDFGTSPLGGSFIGPNYWSGMASIVSSQVGCSMDFISSASGIDRAGPMGQWAIDLLGDANLGIFQRMYPPMAMLSECGYEKYLHCVDELKKTDDKKYADFIALGPSVKLMRDGLFKEAARGIIDYEQKVVNQPFYDAHKVQFGLIRAAGWGMRTGTFGHVDPQSIPVTSVCGSSAPKIPFEGDLTKGDDRVQYFWKLFANWNGKLNHFER